MKTTIRIQNFKSLEDVTLELAPTTVFLGPNGAGKSSVLKCLEFVANEINQLSTNPSQTHTESSKIIEFEKLVYNNETNRKIVFEMKHRSSIEKDFVEKKLGENRWLFPLDKLNKDDLWNYKSRDISEDHWLSQVDLSSFSEDTQIRLRRLYNNNKEQSDLLKHYGKDLVFLLRVEFATDGQSILKSFMLKDVDTGTHIFFSNRKNEMNSHVGINLLDKRIQTAISKFNAAGFEWELSRWNLEIERQILKELINEFLTNTEYQGIENKEDLLLLSIVNIIKLTKFFPEILFNFLNFQHIPPIRISPDSKNIQEGSVYHPIINKQYILGLPDKDQLDEVNKIILWEQRLRELKEKDVTSLSENELAFLINYMDSKEYHIYTLIQPKFILVSHINKWFSKLRLAKEIWIEREENEAVIKIKSSSDAIFSLNDGSSGLVQLLPIIIYTMGNPFGDKWEDYYIFIEQPELHLHPKLQAEIAELCSNLLENPYKGKKFIVETHSEHLIRGYQLLIAQGKLKPKNIRFYYFNPVDNKTEVINLKVDKLGNFITPWPNGFFSDAYDLTLKLLKTQLERRN